MPTRLLRPALVESALVLAFYLLATALLTWPLVWHLGDAQLGEFPNDGTGGVAWLWESRREGGYSLVGSTYHTLTGAPLGWEQGSALNYQWLLPYYPTYLLAGIIGEQAAFNICILLGFALSGAAMYLLVRWLGCDPLVAAWAGLVYVIFPWHLQRALLGVGSLVHIEIFPLLLLAALAWLRRPTDGRAALVGLAIAGAWLTSGYFGTIGLVGLIAFSAVALVHHRVTLGMALAVRKVGILWGMALVGAGAVAALSIFVGGTVGVAVGKTAGEVGYWGAHLRDYLPVPVNSITGAFADRYLDDSLSTFGYAGAEGPMFPGILTVVLAATALWALRRSASETRRLTAVALVAVVAIGVVFAAPSPMTVLGVDLEPMPSRLLFEVVPSFRVPTRFAALFVAALVPLAAFGLARACVSLGKRLPSPRAARLTSLGICGTACAVSVLELGFLPMPWTRIGELPPAYDAVARTPPGVLAEYPLEINSSPHSLSSAYLYWQRVHRRPLLNGAGRSTPADSIRRMLVDPAAPGTASSLALLGVTAVVTRPTTYEWDQMTRVADRPTYGAGYRLVARLPAGVRVWRVAAPAAPAIAAFRGGDVDEPEAPAPDGFVAFPVTGSIVHVDIYAQVPGSRQLRLDVRMPRAETGSLVVEGRAAKRVISIHAQTRVSVPVAIPRGHSVITLTFSRAEGRDSTGPEKRIALSSTWLLPQQSGPVVHPLLVSSDPGF